jgi:hypothetical protein
MNIIKVLSNKKWGISIKTLTEVYNSLIRSLMDYSSILYPAFSATNLDFLDKIQFRCIKIRHRKSKYESSGTIKNQPGYMSIAKRFDDLNIWYIRNAFIHYKELIMDLYRDYREFSDARNLRKTSLFCKYKNQITY